jgi:enoyl-CoA hydratase
MIEREATNDILTLRLAHGKANALDLELCEALTRELRAADGARAVILTGSGSIFCAGVDLFRMTNEGGDYVARFFPALRETLHELVRFPRPVVAAANGHAIAGGCLLVAACDHRLMSGGKIGVPELLVGLPFPAIAIEILRLAAGRQAPALAYSGATLAPDEARAAGLIDEVVAADALPGRATAAATRLAAIPPESFRLTKMQLRAPYLAAAEALAAHDEDVRAVWETPERHAGIRDYLAKTVGKR